MEHAPVPLRFGTLVVFTDGTDRAHRASRRGRQPRARRRGFETYVIGVGQEVDRGPAVDASGARAPSRRRTAPTSRRASTRSPRASRRRRKRYYLLSYCSPSRAGRARRRHRGGRRAAAGPPDATASTPTASAPTATRTSGRRSTCTTRARCRPTPRAAGRPARPAARAAGPPPTAAAPRRRLAGSRSAEGSPPGVGGPPRRVAPPRERPRYQGRHASLAEASLTITSAPPGATPTPVRRRRRSKLAVNSTANPRKAGSVGNDPHPHPPAAEKIAHGQLVIGRLVRLDARKRPLVEHPFNHAGHPVPARFAVPLTPADVGSELVLTFEGGDPGKPIVIGRLLRPDASAEQVVEVHRPDPDARPAARSEEQLVFSAEREIVLRCGEASVTLTRAGKILLRGTYLLSRSTGINRIKGGAVQIN